MASCHKCGRGKIRKRPDGRKKCPQCGFLPEVIPIEPTMIAQSEAESE